MRSIGMLIFILSLVTNAVAQSFGIFQTSSGAITGWHTLHIGGGGYLTHGNQSADGLTTVARGDVYGGYVAYNGGTWVDVINSNSIPSSIITAAGFPQTNIGIGRGGPYEIVVGMGSGQNSDLAAIWMGYLLISTNRGATFSKCPGWSQLTLSANIDGNNGSFRMSGPHIAIDPATADVIYVGTPQNGVFEITGATGSCTATSLSPGTIPTAGSAGGSFPGYVIAFDSSGGTTSGKTNNIYVQPWGNKISFSTNAGSSWSAMAGGPSSGSWSMSVCSNGTLWTVSAVGDYTGGNYNLWKYTSGSWTQMTATAMTSINSAAQTVACDPFNSSHVVVTDQDGNPNWTSNAGTSWSGHYQGHQSQTATDVPWLAWLSASGAANGQLSPGGIFFDNAVQNKLWMTAGFGVWYAGNMSTGLALPGSGGTVAWNSFTAGTEVENALGICSPPNGNSSVMLTTEQLLWYIPNVNTLSNPYPSNGTPSTAPSVLGSSWSSLLPGWSCDYAAGSPNFMVGMANGLTSVATTDMSGDSSNSGATFTPFSAQTGATYSGTLMAGSTSVFVALTPSGPYRTTNGGTSWSAISITGANSSGWPGNLLFVGPKVQSCADKVNANTFYLMNTVNGLYVSTDGAAATWTLAADSGLTPAGGFINKLICVPKLGSVNTAGHLLWNPGNYQSQTNPIYFSNNSGASWVQIPGISTANSVGIGAPKPGGNGYPVIWAVGVVGGVYGIWHCDDYNSSNNTGCASWINVATWPNNNLDAPVGIDGDQNTYNRAYIAFQGSGFAQWNYLLNRDFSSASNDNSPAWLAKVA